MAQAAPDGVPHRRDALPFVKQNRACAVEHTGWRRFSDPALRRIVEPSNGRSTLEGCRRFANRLRTVQDDGGQRGQELVELCVHHPAHVLREEVGSRL